MQFLTISQKRQILEAADKGKTIETLFSELERLEDVLKILLLHQTQISQSLTEINRKPPFVLGGLDLVAGEDSKAHFIGKKCKDGRVIYCDPNAPNETTGVFADSNKFNCGFCGGFVALDWEADLYKWHICHNCDTQNKNPRWQPNPSPLNEHGEQAAQHDDNPDAGL